MNKAKQLTRLVRSLFILFSFICSLVAFGQVFTISQKTASGDILAGEALPMDAVSVENVPYQAAPFDSEKNTVQGIFSHLGGTAILTLAFIAALLLALWYRWRSKNLYNHAQSLACLVRERTLALKQAKVQLEKLACVDVLTNTCNRRQFMVEAEKEFERFYRSQHHFSVLRIEIDNFHDSNESYGFACGDHVLKEVAGLLKLSLRCGDTLARWGNKEFIILLPDTRLEGAEMAGKKLAQIISTTNFCYQNKQISQTLSIGAVQIELGESFDTCMQRADKALTQAGSGGGGQTVALSALAQLASRKKIFHHYG